MVKRSIIIFPKFGNDINLIQAIRDRYDPLAQKIAPHITLVFPFESEILSSELHQHLHNKLYDWKLFNITLQGISCESENYLFLNVVQGQKEIIKIHDLFYSGLLNKFLSKKHIYKPHLTVGRLENSNTARIAMDRLKDFDYKFETKINKITTEIISNDLSSTIDFELEL